MNIIRANKDDFAAPRTSCETPQAESLSRRLVRGGAWSILGRIGSMGALFAMNVVLARNLSKADYSAFLAAASLVPFLAMLATLGVPYVLVRALRGQWPDQTDQRRILRGALRLTLFGSIGLGGAMLALSPFLPDDPKWIVMRDFPISLSLWFGLSALCLVCASFLQGVDDFASASFIGARNGGIVSNALAAIGAGAAAWLGYLHIDTIVSLQVASLLASTACAIVVIPLAFRRLPTPLNSPAASAPEINVPRASLTIFSAVWYLLESWPNLINQLLGVALIDLDLFWVSCLGTEDAVADYGVIRNLRMLVTAPLLVASLTLAPFVAELYGKGDLQRLERMLRGTATVLAGPSLIALIAMLAFPGLVITWTFGEEFVQASNALRIASIGCMIFVISGNNGLTLTMTGRHRDLMICSIISLGLYLAISPYLIHRFGVIGAATAFTIQVCFQNILVTLWVRRVTGIWTVPMFSPSAVRDEAARLLVRLKK